MSLDREDIHQSILAQIGTFKTYSLDFLFTPNNHPYLDVDSIYTCFQKEWETAKPMLENKDSKQNLVDIIFPTKPYDLTVIQTLRDLFLSSSLPHHFIFLDMCIVKILTETSGKYRNRVSPQLLIELLNFHKLRSPAFLVIIKPIIQIILDNEKRINHAIRSHACEVLINNYEIEALFIYISRNTHLKEKGKQILFQSLTAFQKIYRKFLELRVGICEKDLISRNWFGVSYNELRQNREWRDSFSNLVKRFIAYLKERNKNEALQIGRFLVLRFNNEDILRIIHYEMSRDPDLPFESPVTKFIYHQTFKVMQEFRKSYISQKVDTELTHAISEAEAQTIDAMRMVTVGKVPASLVIKRLRKGVHSRKTYPIIPEFMEKLDAFNLKALFELYPIPHASQQIFTLLANMTDNMELDHDEFFHFIAYMEKLLIFLQRFTEMDITVEKDPFYGLIKNPYQLNSLHLIKEGTYFASTGLWYQNTIPPSIIRCICPNAIPNCIGVKDRHIFSRISLLTGAFRGSPFDLDSTNRYDWDEEDETCVFRPGYVQIFIPQHILEQWEETQNIQKSVLKDMIQVKQWS
jgi:hypothetical protein